jgi:phospholipase C
MLEDEFAFYEARQNEIVKGRLDEFAVAEGRKALGYFKAEEALLILWPVANREHLW